MPRLILRRARCLGAGDELRDVILEGNRVRELASGGGEAVAIDLEGMTLLPAFVNAHDVLDTSVLPAVGNPPYRSHYEWLRASQDASAQLGPALAMPLADRLFLGGVRNLLAGVASVLHHHPDHRSLARDDFPVRVQRRYSFAHSPGLTPALRRTYRTSDRRIPWIVRAAEGSDPVLRQELDLLAAANVLRQNTVIAHGTALAPEDGPRLAAAEACLAWCPESDLRLYGRTAPFAGLRAAGVRVGLGSDGAPAGARDFLSNLAVAWRESGLDERGIVELATIASAEVARLPVGGFSDGAPADLLATRSLERLLAGEREGVALLIVRGAAIYGEPQLLAAGGVSAVPLRVDGAARALAAATGRRLASALRGEPRAAAWLAGVAL
jgi:cytosine/adenosine deaminase-related metal-dependent hydrolase